MTRGRMTTGDARVFDNSERISRYIDNIQTLSEAYERGAKVWVLRLKSSTVKRARSQFDYRYDIKFAWYPARKAWNVKIRERHPAKPLSSAFGPTALEAYSTAKVIAQLRRLHEGD